MTEEPKLIFKCSGKGFVSIENKGIAICIDVPLNEKGIEEYPTTYNQTATVWKYRTMSEQGGSKLINDLLNNGIRDEYGGHSGTGLVQAFDDGNMELSVSIPNVDGGFIEAKTICGASDLSIVRNELEVAEAV
jgi:hypothetical protein